MQEAGGRLPTATCHLPTVYLRLGGELTKRRWACYSLDFRLGNLQSEI